MSIGPEIKEVLQEVGATYTILREGGNITGEKTYYKTNSQVTKPFIREFFLEAWFQYDTQAVGGDYIQFSTTGDIFIVMNSTPYLFENTAIRYDVVLYKCNVLVDIVRPEEPDGWDSDYRKLTTWRYIGEQKPALITTPLYGHDLATDEELGYLGLEVHEMYAPVNLGIRTLDRIRLTSTEYFRVETIKPRRYKDVNVFELGEDTRVAQSTTTTTTTTVTTTSTLTSTSSSSSSSSSSSTLSSTSTLTSTSSSSSTTTTTA